MILFFSVPLMTSIIVANVVLFPLPVVPVSSVSPRSAKAISLTMCGKFNSSIVGIVIGMTRTTIPMFPRCEMHCSENGPNQAEHKRNPSRRVTAASSAFATTFGASTRTISAVSVLVSGGLSTIRSSLASRNIGAASPAASASRKRPAAR